MKAELSRESLTPDSRDNYPIVLVYLGDSIPKYVRKNLRLITSLFQNRPVVLIYNSKKAIQKNKVPRVDYWYWNEGNSKEATEVKEQISHNREFREDFWINSLIRLFALKDFVLQERIDRALHIEADVILSPVFPFEDYLRIRKGLAYPLVERKVGIASILYIASNQGINDLVQFALKKVKQNPKLTDMILLGEFQEEFQNSVTLIPTIDSGLRLKKSSVPIEQCRKAILNPEEFRMIHDACSVGQYFFGEDPRNAQGLRKVFRVTNSHFVDARGLSIEISSKGIYLKGKGGELIPIANLHIHAKDLRAFDLRRGHRLARKRSHQEQDGGKDEWTFHRMVRAWQVLKHKVKLKLRKFS